MSDIGHNDPAAARALEGIREYQAGVLKEQAGRDDAIAGIIKYGAGLREGRVAHGTNNNAFGDWIVARGLDEVKPFYLRQERSAAMQIAEIAAHVAKETVDRTSPVNPFRGCPNSRPTDIMAWWRKKHANLLTMAHAKTIGERAAKILRDHRGHSAITNETSVETLEWIERDPFAALMDYREHEGIIERLEVWLGLRAAPPKHEAASAAPSPVQAAPPVPPTAPNAASAAPDRIQRAADSAEIVTLKGEIKRLEAALWKERDKREQFASFLAEKPQPKAEERPASPRYWQLPETLERRPKDVPPRQIVDPGPDLKDDPAFALRREEFEQWLTRRKEELEMTFAAKVEAKVKARVEARFVREDAHGRVFTEAQFMDIWRCLHPDSRKTASDKALARAFRLLQGLASASSSRKTRPKPGLRLKLGLQRPSRHRRASRPQGRCRDLGRQLPAEAVEMNRDPTSLALLLDAIAARWLDLSQREIAAKLGIAAGTVSGLVMRARRRGDRRFPSRPNPGRISFEPRRTKSKAKVRKVKPAAIVESEPEAEPLPVPFARLRAGQCKYVVNATKPFLFCAKPAPHGNYCASHATQTRVSGSASPRAPFQPGRRR